MSPRDRNPRKAAHRLADMTGQVSVVEYRPPGDARVENFTLDLDGASYMYVETHAVGSRVLWFVITQWYRPDPELQSIRIARIDCCRNSVHEHRYDQDDRDVLDHRVLCDLTQGDPGTRVHETFDRAYDLALDNWGRNLELWRAS